MSHHERIVVALVRAGFLRVDEDGVVWRCQARSRTGAIRTISPTRADRPRQDGYRRVVVQVDGTAHSVAAHRLVWLVMVGPIPEGFELNHYDGDRGNNALSNLELATKTENLQHSYDVLGRPRMRGERNGRSKLTAGDVAAIRRRAAAESGRALAREFDVSHTMVRNILAGKAWDEFPQAEPSTLGLRVTRG